VYTNENDENSGTTRLTRAKAAALTVPDHVTGSGKITKKTTITSKTVKSTTSNTANTANTANAAAVPAGRKRAALGDVSNVTKHEIVELKDGRKPMHTKSGLVSKAAHNAGVQKVSRSNSSRSILTAKDNNKKTSTAELKRPASGSGVMGGPIKKRNTGSTASQQSIKEDAAAGEKGIPKKSSVVVEIAKRVTVDVKEEVPPEEPLEDIDVAEHGWEEEILDLDADDVEDPLMVAEYVVEIFEYLRDLETTTMPNPHYMDHQESLRWDLRGVLVDWLIEVHTRFHLVPETIFLAVNIIDRFLSTKIVELDRLQLVGITAMFIASKYEEVLSPHIHNFKHVADDGFSEEEILKAERYVLAELNYDLSYPNPINFLRRISKADNYDIQTRTVAKYLLEISLLDHRLMKYHPSHLAAGAMYLARLILRRGPWVGGGQLRCCNIYADVLRMPPLHTTRVTLKRRSSRCFCLWLITCGVRSRMKRFSRNMPARNS
jgi:G2/mitotic-specific cyclin 1/2